MTDTTTATTASTTAATTATAWHSGLAPELTGWAQNKGWITDNPKEAFEKVVTAYRHAEGKLGWPADQVVKLPSPNASPADLDAFWGRFGAVKEAKDIDFSAIKNAAGQPIDAKLAEAIASAAIQSRVPKDATVAITSAIQKQLDAQEAELKALRTSSTNEQVEALKKNWGGNYERNMVVADTALKKWAAAANVSETEAKQAIDALSKVGGIGAAKTLEMLRILGERMGEDRLVTMPGPNGSGMPMTQEAAKSKIADLKKDAAWVKKWASGDVTAKAEMSALAKIATGQSSYTL